MFSGDSSLSASLNVDVIIPCLNEPYLNTLVHQLGDYTIRIQTEIGLSFAVWKGIQQSSSDVIVVMDGDGSHNPNAIKKMIQLLDQNTWLVVGSRYCLHGYSEDSVVRKIISYAYCLITRILLRTSIRDGMSGFWVGYRKAFIFTPSATYKFGIQLIKRYKNHIKEYPIVFRKRKQGSSHVKPYQALKDLAMIFYAMLNS